MMTKRTFLQGVQALEGQSELVAYATAELEKLDEQNERRKDSKANREKAEQNAQIAETLKTLVTGKFTAKQAVDALKGATGETYTTQKVLAVLKPLIESGEVVREYPEQRSKPATYEFRKENE